MSNDQVVVIEDNFAFLLQTSYNLVVRMQLQLIEKNVKTINKTTITQPVRNQSAPVSDWPIEGAGLGFHSKTAMPASYIFPGF